MSFYPQLMSFALLIGFSMEAACQLDLIQQVIDEPGQIVLPYNPDEDASGAIGAADLLPFLIYYGNPVGFYESESSLDSMSLENILVAMSQLLLTQQNDINALQSQLEEQTAAINDLLPLYPLIPIADQSTYSNSTWTLNAMNVQLINGAGATYNSPNGLGNLILGYNEEEGGHHNEDGTFADSEIRTGSHNLVIGSGHTYGGSGAMVGGHNNTSFGLGASIFSGQSNMALGTWSAALGGLDNRVIGSHSCISGGHSNVASGDRSSVSGGLLNESSGIATSILGGQYMQVFEQYQTASGQYNVNE